MSNDQPSKTPQRFSRYSRPEYDDPPPTPDEPREPSLVELTERALRGETLSYGLRKHQTDAPPERDNQYTSFHTTAFDNQPPPPETSLWEEYEPGDDYGNRSSRDNEHTRSIGARSDRFADFEFDEPETRQQTVTEIPDAEAAIAEPAEKVAEKSAKNNRSRHVKKEPTPEELATKKKRRELRREKAAKGIVVLKTSAQTAWKKSVPALTNSGLWLARNLRRRELRRRFNRMLVFGHTRIADRKIEQLFFVPTRKAERLDPAPDRGIHYDGPVPAKAFDWVMSFLPDDLREFAFIDVRAGLGRTSLLAANYNFKTIVAYEYDQESFDNLQMNIAQYPRSRMKCRQIDAHRGDVKGIVMPNQPCIIYFSGAWRETLIDGVMNYVIDTYQQSPRRIYVILENTDAATALQPNKIFDVLEPPVAQRLKLSLLSPVDFKVYRSIA